MFVSKHASSQVETQPPGFAHEVALAPDIATKTAGAPLLLRRGGGGTFLLLAGAEPDTCPWRLFDRLGAGAPVGPGACLKSDAGGMPALAATRDAPTIAFACLVAEGPARTTVRWNGERTSETVFETFAQSSGLAAAATHDRRWVLRSQQRGVNDTMFVLRLAISTSGAGWRELEPRTGSYFSCAVAALDDSSCLVVGAGQDGLAWWTARGTAWTGGGMLDATSGRFLHVRLDPRRPGRVDLYASTREGVQRFRFVEGRWTPAGSARGAHPDGGTYWATWLDLAGRGLDGPRLVTWGERGYGATRRDVLCATWWSDAVDSVVGVEVPGSEGGVQASADVDPDGVGWLAWRALRTPDLHLVRVPAAR